jgi:phosphate transport system substrate-binding protein
MEQVTIKGSTTMTPLLERLAADYQHRGQEKMIIDPVGSLDGIRALIRKTCDIAASSVPVPAELIREAEKENVHLKAFPVCRDRIFPIVNTANPVTRITEDQLKDIFTGRTSSWKALGGPDVKIQIVLRKASSGTCRAWNHMILNDMPAAPDSIMVSSNSGVLAAVAENKYAIGYVSSAYLNHEVKPVELTGNKKAVHLERNLLLYVNTRNMSGDVRAFLTYLHSGPARQIIIDSGFFPMDQVE